MNQFRKIQVSDERSQPPFTHFLVWLILFNVVMFAGYAMWREGYVAKVLEADRSMISLVIALVFVAASIHVAVHLFRTSLLLGRAAALLDGHRLDGQRLDGQRNGAQKGRRVDGGVAFDGGGLVDDFVLEMGAATTGEQGAGIDQANYIFEIYVDKLRSPLELGSFVIDVLIRLGLIGTIIGFIMMLQSFVSGPSPTAENIQELLITMSSGMGTALYTTFAGLVASTLLALQHQLLNRNVEGVVAALIRLSDTRHLRRAVGGVAGEPLVEKEA